LQLSYENLPEACAMRDGRKWKSIPFVLISEQPYHFVYPQEISRLNVTLISPSLHTHEIPLKIEDAVDKYIKRVLEDYDDLGLLVRFDKGTAQMGPALKKKDPEMESAYYYAPGDRRSNRSWVTVMREPDAVGPMAWACLPGGVSKRMASLRKRSRSGFKGLQVTPQGYHRSGVTHGLDLG
jgi:hypothetical protein